MKSCLKQSSSYPNQDPQLQIIDVYVAMEAQQRKFVTFSDSDNEEYYADVWDRTPMEVTQRLCYKDVLELKELRIPLPRVRPVERQTIARSSEL